VSGLPKYPDNWLTVSLSEVIQIQKGKKPFNLGLRDDARTVPYINIAAFETKKIAEYAPKQDAPECSPSDTLLVWDGARAGLSGRGVAGYIGSTLARISSDLATPDYLFHFINSKYDELNSRTKGVGIPHIDPTVLKEIEFLLAPFKEQTRIVQKLEELLSDLDAGVAELKAAQKKLAQYRQSLLKAAVEGKLTQHWREQHRAPSPSPQPLSHQGTGALGVDGVNDVAANYQLPLSDKKTSTREQNPELPNTPQSATLPSPLVGEGPGVRALLLHR
jgi:type I restriction enzyme S subunit